MSLCDLAERSHDRTDLLVDLLNQLHEELRTLATEPDAIGLQADELCLQRGDWLTIDTGTETVEGRCFGIQPDGALVLETATGPRRFYAGVLRRS